MLDLGLPDLDGTDVLRDDPQRSRAVPVIVVTAQDEDAEMVPHARRRRRRLRRSSPSHADQLDARIHAVLRGSARTAHGGDHAIVVGDLTIDRPAHVGGRTSRTSRSTSPAREFDLLALPGPREARHGGEASRSCSPRCGASPYGGADKTIDVHLSWLRRKLGETAGQPRFLHTVRGVGREAGRSLEPVR